jgi:hypothetical protein
MLPFRRTLIVLAAAGAALGAPAVAGASSVSLEGNTLVVRAAPGEHNWLTVGPAEGDPSHLSISDISVPSDPGGLCTSDEWSVSFTTCVKPSGGVRLEAADGDDIVDVDDDMPAGYPVTADGGSGNDTVRGPALRDPGVRLFGGAGNDKVYGGPGPDTVDGGPGDDELEGREGADVVRGGDGNDDLQPDNGQETDSDVVDGGAGWDQIEMNWQSEPSDYQPPINVSIDGVANDGRPGERDNVVGIERIYLTAPATLTGSDGPDELTFFNSDGPSHIYGRGGDDRLSGFDLADTIDGGAGDDVIEGGYGHDVITGGPGRDQINADTSASCGIYQCRDPYGNDTVHARDGEADTIACGVGQDVVEADAIDTVSPDCETVSVGGGVKPVPEPREHGRDQHGGRAHGRGASLRAVHARRHGRVLRVTGRVRGAARVRVKATRAGHRVAARTGRVGSGRFSVRLRVPRHGALRATVRAGAAHRTVRVR